MHLYGDTSSRSWQIALPTSRLYHARSLLCSDGARQNSPSPDWYGTILIPLSLSLRSSAVIIMFGNAVDAAMSSSLVSWPTAKNDVVVCISADFAAPLIAPAVSSFATHISFCCAAVLTSAGAAPLVPCSIDMEESRSDAMKVQGAKERGFCAKVRKAEGGKR